MLLGLNLLLERLVNRSTTGQGGRKFCVDLSLPPAEAFATSCSHLPTPSTCPDDKDLSHQGFLSRKTH